MRPLRDFVRLAGQFYAIYEKRRARRQQDRRADWHHLKDRFEQSQRQRQLVEKARSRGWHLAASQVELRLKPMLEAVQAALAAIAADAPQPTPALQDLFTELHSIQMEFDDVTFDKKDFVAIRSDPIVLEDVDLGCFSVRLNWRTLLHQANSDCFEIVALQPNPAGSDGDTLHPHVRRQRLCAGEATLPLQKALEQGRLTDAFQLVLTVLGTYNPDSAYTPLADWGGVSCWSCGASANEDDRYFCEGCDQDLCSDCTVSCKHCDRTRCSSCLSRCDVCNEGCCRRCLTKSACSDVACCKDCLRVCEFCDAKVAPEELDEETQRCPACQQAATAAETDESKCDESAPAAAE